MRLVGGDVVILSLQDLQCVALVFYTLWHWSCCCPDQPSIVLQHLPIESDTCAQLHLTFAALSCKHLSVVPAGAQGG